MKGLFYINEPKLLFGHEQACADPRDGLSLFGPVNRVYGIKSGVVATHQGFSIFKKYIHRIQRPVYNANNITRPMFPGFEAVFECKWENEDLFFLEVGDDEVDRLLYNESTHKRTYDLVTLFIEKIIGATKNQDEKVDVWFIVVPDRVYKYCRPKAIMPKHLVRSRPLLTQKQAATFRYQETLFDEINQELKAQEKEALIYDFDAQFHDQLKARLLQYSIPTQIFRESTLNWREVTNKFGEPLRDFSKIEGHLAWTISTAAFYKAGGRPWKLSDIRSGVCYLGLVYKRMESRRDPKSACCAAQMFLDNGDGTVFKGEVGPWYNPKWGEFHLLPGEARSLMTQAITSYLDQMGHYPREVFVHAKTRFNREEWKAFEESVPEGTKVVGVTINLKKPLKLFRIDSKYPIMRGNAFRVDDKSAFLWTIGYVPRLQTALGMEVPNPLYVEINKGQADIDQVLQDILALTKLNYNACIYGDGIPVTLRFADRIGEILTATAGVNAPPLAFKYYI